MSLEAMVGRQLIVGLPGPDATDDDVRLLRDIHAGGLMLYRRNFETPERFVRFIRRREDSPRATRNRLIRMRRVTRKLQLVKRT